MCLNVQQGVLNMYEIFSCFILIEPVTDPRSAFPYSGGESQALARLKHYFWDTVSTTEYK